MFKNLFNPINTKPSEEEETIRESNSFEPSDEYIESVNEQKVNSEPLPKSKMTPYNLSSSTWGNEEIDAIYRVIKSNRFTMGKEVSKFEKEFALKMGVKYAVMSNSGSSANLLAVASLVLSGRLKKGDEVIVPAVSWSTTYFPLSQYGLKLRFVDIDLQTLNIDLDLLEKAVTKKTKAICVVNLLGNPNDYNRLFHICYKYKLLLIEDSCESMGGKYNGTYLGNMGIIGTYSMYFSHHLCSIEGGITVTDNEEIYNFLLCLRSHGWTRHLPDDNKIYQKHINKFYEDFNFILPGYNLRPTDLQGAIAREQLKKLDGFIEQRRKNAEYFKYLTINLKDSIIIQKEISKSSWFGFSIILNRCGLRERVLKILNKNKIETRPIVAGNFTRNPVIDFLDYSIYGKLTNANIVHENGFFIGNHSTNIIPHLVNITSLLMEVL